MNYTRIYTELIARAQHRNDAGKDNEKHHIIPKSHGGSNNHDNLVWLTPREHFIAHHLLWKIHKNKKMFYAFWCMSTLLGRDKNVYKVTSTIYENAKKQHKIYSSMAHKGNTPWNKGKTGVYTIETLTKMSVSKIKRIETEETRLKKSQSHIGIKKGPSPLKGRNMPIDNKWFVTCPYCEKHGAIWNMKRYHFENCKKVKK